MVKAFQLTNGLLSTTPVSQTTNGWGFPGSSPSVSANGTTNGIVWTIQVTGYKTGVPAILHAYDAIDLTRELYNSNQVTADKLESGVKFSTPIVANGKVYVGTQSTLVVYGILASGTLGNPTNLTATAVSTSGINLAWAAATGPVTSYRVERCQGAGCTTFAVLAIGVAGTTYNDTGLSAATSYSYRVQASDAVGHASGYSNTATATTPAAGDTTPPTNPSSLTATAVSSSQINTSWTASTDDTGVTGYLVERCQGTGCATFAQVATVTTTSYNDTGLIAATSYSYRVRATDATGNQSGYSNVASTATSSPPPAIAFVQGNFATPQSPSATVTIKYTAAQVAGDLNVVIVGWNDASSTVTSVTDTVGNTYSLAVGPTIQPGPAGGGGLSQSIYYAKNIVGAAAGANTVTVRFSASATFPDVRILEYRGLDQTNPFDVGAGAVGTVVTADSGPATTTSAYSLLVGGNMVWSVTVGPGSGYTSRMITSPDGDIAEDQVVSATGSYRATAAMAGTGPWVMQMAAFRGAGSAPPPPDTTPPTAPSGLTATAASSTQINLAWTASTDNVGVTGYLVERCQGSGCTTFAQITSVTTTSFSDTGLTSATSYSYRVRATDAAGNLSGYSSTATASTPSADTTPPTAPSGLTATPGSETGGGTGGTIVLDSSSFEDPAENPLAEGGKWAALVSLSPNGGRLQKSGGVAFPTRLSPDHGGARTTTPMPADQFSEIVVGAIDPSQGNVGPIARVQASGGTRDSHYLWWVGPANHALYRVDANGATYGASLLANTSIQSAVAGDVCRLIARNAAIYGTLNGRRAFFVWDSTYAGGQTGILAFPSTLTANEITAWQAGSVPALATGSGSWDSSTFTGTDETSQGGLDESDRWYVPDNVPPLWKIGAVIKGSDSANHNFAANWRITPPNDQYAQITLGTVTSGGGGPMVRMNRGAHTGYVLFISKNTPSASGIYAWTGGQDLTLLQAFTPSRIQAGDKWGLFANGTSLDVKLNGVSVGAPFPITNAAYPSGDVGMELFGNVMTITAWEGGDINGSSANQISLAWTASTDNVSVTGYQVERCQGPGCANFAQITSVTGTAYTDSGLAPGTSYSYRVWATDAAGNVSGYSNTATASTPVVDTTPPTAPAGLTATAASSTQINLAWTASADDVGVTSYSLERCQGPAARALLRSPA